MTPLPEALLSLTPYEARTATAIFERLFPADAHDLGATAIGVVAYLDRALAGAYHDKIATYHLALAAFDQMPASATMRPLPTVIARNRMPC